MSATAAIRRASLVLPVDPFERAAYLQTLVGSYVTLYSGDFEVTGMLVTVVQPARHAEHPAPVVIIDTGLERVAGPVLEGDRLV